MCKRIFPKFSVLLVSIMFGLGFGCRDSRDDSCTASEPSSCDGLDLTSCADGQWQTQSCQTTCLNEYGTAAISCGYDAEQDADACICASSDPPSGSGGSGSGGSGIDCSDDFEGCDVNGDCCGFESGSSYCVGGGSNGQCLPICDFDDECSTGCCAELQNGESVCSPSDHCGGECKDAGSICESNGDCCDYYAGTAYCVTFGREDDALCADTCFDGSDCFSGCCVEIDNGESVCASSLYCDNYKPERPLATPRIAPLPPHGAMPDNVAMQWRQ